MDMFEDVFKTRAQSNTTDLSNVKKKVVQKAPSKTSLMETNKAKNLAITLRKGGKTPSAICTAIETYMPLFENTYIKQIYILFIPLSHTHMLMWYYCFAQVRPAGFVHRLPGIARALHTIRL